MTQLATKTADGAPKKVLMRSLREAALDVLQESQNLGPKVAHADGPQKLTPAGGPAGGAIQDLQNKNNEGAVGGRAAGGPDGAPQKLSHTIVPGQAANQDLGASLTNAEDDKMPAVKSVDGGRTSKTPGGNYPTQEKYNPTSKKIFAEDDTVVEDEMAEGDDDEDFEKKFDKGGDNDDDDDKDHKEPDGDEDDKCEDVVQEALVPSQVVEDAVTSVDMTEHMGALFSGNDALSEEFKTKAKTVFEAAVFDAAKSIYETLEGHYITALSEATNKFEAALTESVDDYLGYVVEQWVAENEVAVESGLRSELTENFITGLRELFVNNHIDIPEEKVDVIEELTSQVEDLEAKLNEEFKNAVQLRKELAESRKAEIFHDATRGLTDVQIDKLKGLAESVTFTDATEFAEKLQTLKESYLTASPKVTTLRTLDADPVTQSDGKTLIEEKDATVVNPRIAAYASALGRQVKSATYTSK